MESASWFAWPKNVIASVEVSMTGMIDFVMSLAVNSLLFFSFTKSIVTWVMAMVPFRTAVWICWMHRSFSLSLDVKLSCQFFCRIFNNRTTKIFWPGVNFHFIFQFFIRLSILPNCFKNFCQILLHWLT